MDPLDLKVELQRHLSIDELHTFMILNKKGWTSPIISFLQDGHLLVEADKARKVRKWAAKFTILNDSLYKRGFSMPYFRCIEEEEAKYILEEV